MVLAKTVFPIPGAPSIKMNFGGLSEVAPASVELILIKLLSAVNIFVMSLVTLE